MTIPAGVSLNPTEQYILGMLGTDFGVSTASILAYFPSTGMAALTHLQQLNLIVATPAPVPGGPTLLWYLT